LLSPHYFLTLLLLVMRDQHFKRDTLLTKLSRVKSQISNLLLIESSNVTIIAMINAIVVLIMIEIPIMIMRGTTMDIMITLAIFSTIYFLNIMHNTHTMTVSI